MDILGNIIIWVIFAIMEGACIKGIIDDIRNKQYYLLGMHFSDNLGILEDVPRVTLQNALILHEKGPRFDFYFGVV